MLHRAPSALGNLSITSFGLPADNRATRSQNVLDVRHKAQGIRFKASLSAIIRLDDHQVLRNSLEIGGISLSIDSCRKNL
jgi:hypothetical protein